MVVNKFPTVQQFAYGYAIKINTGVDLTNTTSLMLKLRSPSGVTKTKTIPVANINSPKKAGIISYGVEEGDFDEPGIYSVQLIDNTPGRKIASEVKKIQVLNSL